MSWFGLGKDRTDFGKWCDKQDIDQIEVETVSGLSRRTISRMCNDDEYAPKYSTFAKVQKGMDKLGYDIEYDDFW